MLFMDTEFLMGGGGLSRKIIEIPGDGRALWSPLEMKILWSGVKLDKKLLWERVWMFSETIHFHDWLMVLFFSQKCEMASVFLISQFSFAYK